ncbi:MAG: pyrimidine 5'-nucleotidase [Anaerolineae bacterium]|nr:pyrimidine 5'-nucleotidase [Anaerolineae bacterium]MDW8102368.1 pyrimidine 5'-nucleotidase [Anaerolineae bacterium]
MIKIIAFDLDETLYPTDTRLMEAINERIKLYMVQRLGFDPLEVDQIRQRYYAHYGTSLRGLMVEYGIDPDDFLHFVHDVPLERYLSPNNQPLRRVLSRIPLEKVIFTNASREHALKVLNYLGLAEHFSRIVDIRDLNFFCKPHPEAYRLFLEIVGAKGEECILVDDTPRNLVAAKAFGIITVLVNGEPQEGIDFVIKDLVEIERVVKEITATADQVRVLKIQEQSGPARKGGNRSEEQNSGKVGG